MLLVHSWAEWLLFGHYGGENEMGKLISLMDKLKTWMLWIVLIGVVLDLGISGVLYYQQNQLSQNTAAARCWDRVLDDAINTVKPNAQTRAALRVKAQHCAKLIP